MEITPLQRAPHLTKTAFLGIFIILFVETFFFWGGGGRGGGGESAGRQTSPCLRDERQRRITMHDILTKPFVVHAGRRRPLLYNKGDGGEAEGLIKW